MTPSGDENGENEGFEGLEGRKLATQEARSAKNGEKWAEKAVLDRKWMRMNANLPRQGRGGHESQRVAKWGE